MTKNKTKEEGREKPSDAETTQESGGENRDIIPEEILDALPEEERGRVASIIKQTMISGVMRQSNPITEKITSDHITQIIDTSDKRDARDRSDKQKEQIYNLVLLTLGLIFIGFLVVFLKDSPELLNKIIIAIIAFVGGFGAGKLRKPKDSAS